MKKILFISLYLFCAQIFSQVREKGDIELSPSFGIAQVKTLGTFTDSTGSEITKIRTGINADYYLNSDWSIKSGILYYQMGGSDRLSSTTENDYLNIPININFHFGKKRGFNVNAGVTPGLLLKSTFTSFNSGPIDTKDSVKSIQLGISFGAGYKHQMTEKLSLFFDVQVLTETNNHVANLPSGFDFTRFHSGYSFNLGAVFKL